MLSKLDAKLLIVTLSWGIFDLLGSFLVLCGGREYSSRLTKLWVKSTLGRLMNYAYLWLENLASRSSSDEKFMASFTSLFRFLKTVPLDSSLNTLSFWPSGNLGPRVGNVELRHGLCHQLIAQVNLSLRLRQFTESEQCNVIYHLSNPYFTRGYLLACTTRAHHGIVKVRFPLNVKLSSGSGAVVKIWCWWLLTGAVDITRALNIVLPMTWKDRGTDLESYPVNNYNWTWIFQIRSNTWWTRF